MIEIWSQLKAGGGGGGGGGGRVKSSPCLTVVNRRITLKVYVLMVCIISKSIPI